MPIFEIYTNLSNSKIPINFLSNCVNFLAIILKKDTKWCIATVNSGLNIYQGGSNEPCCIIQIASMIGSVGPKQNKSYIEDLTNFIHNTIGIPKNRLYIFFQSNPLESTGYLGSTIHHLAITEKGTRLT
ncbi:macrophage migration inhibitory factor homolog [Daktulosphaira vitifoliae]|uniref:macrophage migration inhibitory factor homolog n=1 Tax=Daktulosphaira vitifoliae TaxID=58002 RepID=UPI0021A9C534|nr:macrophage migration inhibitory factor homolog [Daktulosphaira vitifoliae]